MKITKTTQTSRFQVICNLRCQLTAHHLNKTVAGVRDGAARPRDQPSGSVQVRSPSKDRPQPVERRFLPLRSLPELPQWLREEVEALQHFHPALVCSSQPPFLLLVRHARTLSPMSDTLVVYIIWTNMPCPVVFHRHSDILILVASSIILAPEFLHTFVCIIKRISQLHRHGLKFFLQISVSFSLVVGCSSSSGASELLLSCCCCCLRFPFPPSIRFRPSTWHLCPDGLPISNIEMIRSCFVISTNKKTMPSLLVTHILFPLFECLIFFHSLPLYSPLPPFPVPNPS